MGKLDGQAAVVFGASSGIGRATAMAFAREGARVVVAARRQVALGKLASEIAERGGEVLSFAADVSKRDEVGEVVTATVERFGRVDVMVNCAGVNIVDRQLAALTQEKWDQIIAINLTGAFNCTQAVIQQMREQRGGLIVHVTSVSGRWGDWSGAAYQASKHGMVGLANAANFEERKNGIRTSLIFPGLTDTPILSNRPSPPTPESRSQMMQPEDIAEACLFLASLPPRTYVPELVIMPTALQCIGQTAL